ncbi:MAG: regulatory protein RecX [Chloroflexi bacterium]|nr:MAG: regulatory protein RecX [Chloroflexota bacterium]
MPRRSSKPPTGSAYEAGVGLLARRAHSRAELRRKLARRGFSVEDVDATMARLSRLGYLDDASFAAGHVRRRSATLGPLALSAELSARGVDRAVAGAALDAFDHSAQVAAATRLAERLSARKSTAGYRELLDSVGARLLRRGFSLGVAREACLAVWQGTATTPEA